MKDHEKRPTLNELAAETNASDPWSCPKCGCKDWRVYKTYDCKDGTKRRTRCCRNCKFVRTTYESFNKPHSDDDIANVLRVA